MAIKTEPWCLFDRCMRTSAHQKHLTGQTQAIILSEWMRHVQQRRSGSGRSCHHETLGSTAGMQSETLRILSAFNICLSDLTCAHLKFLMCSSTVDNVRALFTAFMKVTAWVDEPQFTSERSRRHQVSVRFFISFMFAFMFLYHMALAGATHVYLASSQ